MNITLTYTFLPETLDEIRRIVPDVVLHCSKSLDEVPAEVLAKTEVLYLTGRAPAPAAAPALRWVHCHSAGVDNYLTASLFADGRVVLTTSAGVHAINMSEYALMMMLALAHRMPRFYQMMQAKTWSNERDAFTAMELHGATVGLVGYGALGKQIARLCHALGMKVLVLRRSAASASPEPGEAPVTFVGREDLHGLMRQSDFLVLATPITPETHHMIDADALAQMKPTAFLVNIGRGAVVDEAAMIEALRERRIAGAGLDVFEQEPLPDDSALWTLDNVILSPHTSGLTPKYAQRAGDIFVGNLRRFVAGEPLVNQVDFQRGY